MDKNEHDEQLMVLDDEEKFIKNYQAIYYAMTAKPDSKSRIFPKRVLITQDDIIELNEIIVDKLKKHFGNAGFTINIIISFGNRQTLEFSSWTQFENYKWLDNKPTESITIIWEYNALMPQLKVPQQHRLMVKMSNGIRPEEIINLLINGRLENIDAIDRDISPIVARVDYIDIILADELLDIVEKWTEGLKSVHTNENKLILFMKRHKKKCAYAINYVTVFIAILCCLVYFNKFTGGLGIETLTELSISQFNQIINLIVVSCLVCFGVNKIIEKIANYFFSVLEGYGNEHIFSISKGDKKLLDNQINQKGKADGRKLLFSTILSIALNIICGIITYILTKNM